MHSAFRRGLAALLCLAAALPALAETFPARPITLVVPQGPGSGSDVTARLLAAHLGPELGQTVVVENRAGGSGVLAHQSVMRAPADGHTLLFTSTAQLVVVPMINATARWQLADFTAVAPVLRAPFAVLVSGDAAAPRTAQELVDPPARQPAELCLGWHRHHDAPGRRAVVAGRGCQGDARALQG